VDVKQVGRELGVRYVLEGAIRRSGERIRITTQLNDGVTGVHLWADRIDRALDDIFILQDEIAAKVVGAIAPTLEHAEIERARRKSPDNLDAYDRYLRGKAYYYRASKESTDEALRMFDEAIILDQTFGPAHAFASRCYTLRKAQHWVSNREQEVTNARRYASAAVEFGTTDAVCLFEAGFTFAYVVLDPDSGEAYTKRALELNRNLATAWAASGWIHIWLGQQDSAIEEFSRAMRLSPLDPLLPWMQNISGP